MPNVEEILFPTKKERIEDRRKEGQQRKLQDEFFDHRTLLAISRLVSEGQFEQIDYPISTGKEGGVFRASGPGGFRAVKIHRIGNAVFRRLPPYVLEELLREASARNHARLVYAWTRREHTMLRRLRTAGVRCPEPFGHLRNVLVMEFIGMEGIPSSTLKDSTVSDPQALYQELVAQIRIMIDAAKLVHGDLSPYNILLREDRPVLIDVAQSMPSTHPGARDLLERDVRNFAKYFARLGVDTTWETMFEEVGGGSVGRRVPAG